MEKFNRAVRIHHLKRLKKARANYWGYPRIIGGKDIERMPPRQVGIVVQTPRVTQCMCCSNPRWYLGKTLAEASFDALADIEIQDFLESGEHAEDE